MLFPPHSASDRRSRSAPMHSFSPHARAPLSFSFPIRTAAGRAPRSSTTSLCGPRVTLSQSPVHTQCNWRPMYYPPPTTRTHTHTHTHIYSYNRPRQTGPRLPSHRPQIDERAFTFVALQMRAKMRDWNSLPFLLKTTVRVPCTHTQAATHTHTLTHTFTHARICKHTKSAACTRVHTCTYTHARAHKGSSMHTRAYMRVHARTRTQRQ
jgi:hypothetical protein